MPGRKRKSRALETPYGILSGRDAIFLDDIHFDANNHQLVLKGDINENLCTRPRDHYPLTYVLTFHSVLAFRSTELDTNDALGWGYGESSFDEVFNSPWLKAPCEKITPDHRHFVIVTYDDVIEVMCKGFDFETGDEPKASH